VQTAPPYWQRGLVAQVLVGLQDDPVLAQLPLVLGGQSPSRKQAAYWQLLPQLLQVLMVHLPAWGRQSPVTAQPMPSSLQVVERHCASDAQNFPDWSQRPLAVPPRQLTPSSQSTPTSVPVSNEPPGTPVKEPDVSRTTSMFGLWICREMMDSGSTRAVAVSELTAVTKTAAINRQARVPGVVAPTVRWGFVLIIGPVDTRVPYKTRQEGPSA
jgi:hypothetical protein